MTPPVSLAGAALQVTVPTDPTDPIVLAVARMVGVAAMAGLVATLVAALYRWYVREHVPRGLPVLAGLGAVALFLMNTTSLLADEIAPGGPEIEVLTALVNVVTFVIGGVVASFGTKIGDRLGTDLFAATGVSALEADVSEIVQTVGRVTAVQLPEDVEDIVGYDPVPETTKETLAGRRFLFPKRLTKAELRERLVARLKTDYGVGHVDVEFAPDGDVTYLAVGSRAAGIGPTLAPGTVAVAVQADPAHAASAGDRVQVWERSPPERVLTGELRGVAGDVATVAVDAADAARLDPTAEYRLVTLPVRDRADREFASLLRTADETMATIEVGAGSDLDGAAVNSLSVTVAAITRPDEGPVPLPAGDRRLAAGDVLYALGTPDALRKTETAGEGPAESGGTTESDAAAGAAEEAAESAADAARRDAAADRSWDGDE